MLGVGRSLRFGLCLLGALWLSGPAVAQTDSPELQTRTVHASEHDRRDYRWLRLPSGLRALLIRDPDALRAQWVLDVHAGTNQNPPGMAGLSRLLGQALVQSRPGYRQALEALGATSQLDSVSEHTRFVGQADPPDLARALGHLRSALEQPLTRTDIESAQQHLAEEMRRGLLSDERAKRLDVFSALMNPEHPMARSLGSSASLAQVAVVEPELNRFRDRYYQAGQMSLVLRANEPLKAMQSMFTRQFQGAFAGQGEPPEDYPALFGADQLPLRVEHKTAGRDHELRLLFPIPDARAFYRQKPLAITNRLLSDGGPGSLMALLRSLGWAESIEAGLEPVSRHNGFYQVRIRLTDLGVRARDQVVALVFYRLEQIRQRGLHPWRYTETAQLAQWRFRFDQAAAPLDLPRLAGRLHRVPGSDVLSAPFVYQGFDESLARRYLDYLRSDNVLISFASSEVVGADVSPRWHVPYKAESIDSKHPAIKLTVRRQLHFPPKNDFIPERLSLKETPMLPGPAQADAAADGPASLADNPRFSAWYQQSREYASPRASVFLRALSPGVTRSPLRAVQTELFARLLADRLAVEAYAAREAGADFTVRSHPLGVDIELNGYSSQLGLLLTRVGELFTPTKLSESRFKRVKRALAADLKRPPPDGVKEALVDGLYRPFFTRQRRLKALEQVPFERFERFSRALAQGASARVLYYGNLYRQEAQRLSALTENYFVKGAPQPTPGSALLSWSNEGLAEPAGWHLSVPVWKDRPAGGVYLRALGDSAGDWAHTHLLKALLARRESPREQLGGTCSLSAAVIPVPPVQVRQLTLAGVPGLVLSVEANGFTAAPAEEALRQVLARVPQAREIKMARNSLTKTLQDRQRRADWDFEFRARQLWQSVLGETPSRLKARQGALQSLGVESVQGYYDAMTDDGRRLWLGETYPPSARPLGQMPDELHSWDNRGVELP